MLIVFGRKGCQYCQAAKQLLIFKIKTHKYFDINSPKGLKERKKYKQIPKSFKTVPMVIQVVDKKTSSKRKLSKRKLSKRKLSKNKKKMAGVKKVKFIGGFEDLKQLLILS